MRLLLLATALVVAVGTPAPASAANGYGISAKDRSFLSTAAHGAAFEIAGGALAGTHAHDARVRAFGARMVADHGLEATRLLGLARDLGLQVPTEPDVHQGAVLTLWSMLHGGAFDCSYAPTEYADHEGDIATYQDEAEHGADARIRAFAAAQLPTLHTHLRLAEAALTGLSCTAG